jgi:large subunit ribosomal protein L21
LSRFVRFVTAPDGLKTRKEYPMEAYAVVETGGKQYLLKVNDNVRVELLDAEKGATVELTSVLASSDGSKLTIGTPEVSGAKVTATVVDHIRGPKVISFKKKRRKGYSRRMGHRQELTVLKVESV